MKKINFDKLEKSIYIFVYIIDKSLLSLLERTSKNKKRIDNTIENILKIWTNSLHERNVHDS